MNEKELEAVVGGAAAGDYALLVAVVTSFVNKLPAPFLTVLLNVINKVV